MSILFILNPTPMNQNNSREMEDRFYKEFFITQNHPISGKLKVLKGTKSYEDIANWWHQELQKARHETQERCKHVIEEQIKALKARNLGGDYYLKGLKMAIHLIYLDQSDLDQPTPWKCGKCIQERDGVKGEEIPEHHRSCEKRRELDQDNK